MNADVPVTSCFNLSHYCLVFSLTFSFSLHFMEFLEITSVIRKIFIHLATPPKLRNLMKYFLASRHKVQNLPSKLNMDSLTNLTPDFQLYAPGVMNTFISYLISS